jgi:hypothetical protein
MHSLLIDIGACCEHHSNDALEHLHKAIVEGEPDDIWLPHPSPLLRRLVELFTQRGLMRIEGFINELKAWQEGERHRAGNRPARPDGAMERWTPGELKLVKLYLETLPPDEFTLDDHMMVVDYLAQRYLSPEDLRTEAEWLAVRSSLMGRVQANMANTTLVEADRLLAAMPNTIDQAAAQFGMSAVQRAVMEFGRARAAENVTSMTAVERHRVKRIVMRHQEARALGDTTGPSLQSDLLDAMGEMNRDWRRIAVTEATENQNQGYVASLKPGAKVRRLEQYRNACPWCRKIDGKVMEVVDAGAPDKDGETQIWVGKTNIGRSAAPRKRVGGELVDRTPDEMYWIAAGVQHPHCRGSWLPVIEDRPGDDPDFGDWLRATLAKPEK